MLSSIKQDHLSFKIAMNTIFVQNCLLVQEPATALMDWAVFTQFKKGYFARLEATYDGDAHSPAFLHLNAWEGHVVLPLIRVCML